MKAGISPGLAAVIIIVVIAVIAAVGWKLTLGKGVDESAEPEVDPVMMEQEGAGPMMGTEPQEPGGAAESGMQEETAGMR